MVKTRAMKYAVFDMTYINGTYTNANGTSTNICTHT